MYHSSAVLLRDGRVLVGGRREQPPCVLQFQRVMFPTDLSLEAFSPWYLDGSFDGKRPEIPSPSSGVGVSYGKNKCNVNQNDHKYDNHNLIKIIVDDVRFIHPSIIS